VHDHINELIPDLTA